ncbi:MAG: uroporphyrinogen-III C-methyltransferase [Ruminiclostridium sp.]|nr:uroporphyrinogen-III C-methyltransferase [Ruminiclostridium sp.]
MTGFVYIIGAGCGAYDLITLRGLKALKKCDVIIYDALIDTSLLGHANENAELICVGKRSGKHSASQEEINALLVEKALEGHTVARLKGGDPFVFGRGGEEITELQTHNIPFSVIPGISSCIAAPELAGIPVTHRNVSRAFHVITAHTANDKSDFTRYAGLDGTIVFLMGLAALRDIADGLVRGGMSPETPAAIISDGGTAKQKTVRGTLADIVGKAAGMTAPAVIVVGETAAYDFSDDNASYALHSVSVTVTGTAKFTGKVSALLKSEGAKVHLHSHVTITKKHDIPALDGYSCIAFTSSYGAELFIADCREKHIDLRTLAGIKIAAVGSGTAETLGAAGLIPDIVPTRYTVAALADAIADNITGKVLILRAELGSVEFTETLDRRGTGYDDVKIYDTTERNLPAIFADTNYIVFGSSFGVRSFFDRGSTISEKTTVVCIGVQTQETAEKYTKNRMITASPHSAEGVLNVIKGDRK